MLLPGSESGPKKKGKLVEKHIRHQNDLFQIKVLRKVTRRK